MVDSWLLDSVRDAIGHRASEWRLTPAEDANQPWILAEPSGNVLPAQGWKLHVSSYGSTAAETLRRVLPTLVSMNVAFKVIGSIAWLRGINRGAAGLSQVGKFITVYPAGDSMAVSVATALARAAHGLRGPRIPSDRPLDADGVLYYRYGSFGNLRMQTRLGEVVPALIDSQGTLVPDRRGAVAWQPSWVTDPFAARGLAAAAQPTATVAGRYRPVAVLSQSPGVVVQLALDVVTPRACVLKRARLRAPGGTTDDDGGARLQREGTVLAQLADLGLTPRLYDVVDDGEELVVVTEDLGGQTLEQTVRALTARGRLPPRERVVELGIALTDALTALHERGYIHGDVKSANIVIGPDGRLRLIDLDLAQPIGSGDRPAGAGTRGYTSPDCRAGRSPAPTDDIFALGAVLYLLITGAEPSRAPDVDNLLNRSPALMNPRSSSSLATVVERCLSDAAGRRFTTAREVRDALLASGVDEERGGPSRAVQTDDHRLAAKAARRQALRAADLICAKAEASDGGLVWRSTYLAGKGMVGRDVNSGMAGTILALAELTGESRDERHVDVLRRAAWTLHDLPAFPGDRPPGLYVGDMGVVAALLRAGQILGDADLVAAAIDRAGRAAQAPIESPDLFHGAAGRLLVHLLLWDETGDQESLGHAISMGELLLEHREGGPDEARWRIPGGYEALSGKCYLGYAHGAAGIADALLDLFEATGDSRFVETAADAIAWIARQGVPVLDDQSGLGWPLVEGGAPYPPFWCHGATGIGRVLLHAGRLGVLPDAADLVRRAARSVAQGARWSGPTLCHGLSGNAELLLDVGDWTGERQFVADAHRLMALVNAFSVESDDGSAWITEAPRQITPDYLVGYGGVALVHLRLARPDRAYQLSRAGFRYRPPTARIKPAAG